jgi:hypothetical protein
MVIMYWFSRRRQKEMGRQKKLLLLTDIDATFIQIHRDITRVGKVVWPPQVAEPKRWQNEYFKCKYFIFCTKQILNN